MTHAVECLPVVQAGEDVVVALPLGQASLGSTSSADPNPQHDMARLHGHTLPDQLDVLNSSHRSCCVHLQGTSGAKSFWSHTLPVSYRSCP